MSVKIAINGFGRIGRLVFRALLDQQGYGREFEVVAVNDLAPADNLAYLLKYDSVQGMMSGDVLTSKSSADSVEDDCLEVGGRGVRVLNIKEGPAAMPWRELGVDVVVESTGLFNGADKARGHLDAGARKVLITAPSKGEDITVVLGVNDHQLDLDRHHIISNASCTTNCLAPIVHVLLEQGVGIEEGLMTTVHAYTATQKTVDGPSKKDWRSGRSASTNIIPAATGAARAVGLVCPRVQGRLTGMAFRVPVATVSVVDLTVRTEQATSMEEVNGLMRQASETYLKGIMGYTRDPVVSSDFVHNTLSSIYDEEASMGLNDRFFKLVSWYDNEWGYACRVADLVNRMAAHLSRA